MATGEEGGERPRKATVDVSVEAECGGYNLIVDFAVPPDAIRKALDRLKASGVIPRHRPIVWDQTADGLPICPKHKVPMRRREKQGDSWFSHNAGSEKNPLFCKGYPGPDSPGYEVEMGGED